jgi:hypothetical protein
MKPILLSVAVLAGTWCGVTRADLMFQAGNTPQPGEENVLLNPGDTGATIYGTTQLSGLQVQFSSLTDTLTVPVGGTPRIEATDGELNSLTISLPGATFQGLIINPVDGDGDANLTVVSNEPEGGTSVEPFGYTLGAGNNFATITATNGETIESVTLEVVDGFVDLRQTRIAGSASVPEPASASLGVLSVASLVGLRPKRRA